MEMMSIKGRESQYQKLTSALGPDLPSALLLWGLPSTGKTYILNQVISNASIYRTARLSAAEIMCGRRPFFETLLRQLQVQTSPTDTERKCENLRMFLRSLQILQMDNMNNSDSFEEQEAEGRIVIILDEAEHLRKEHSDILNVFLKLQEFTHNNICVILTSTLSPISFSSVVNMRSVPAIHFPQYSKDEIVDIITNCYSQPCKDPELFRSYVGMVVQVFYQVCRDLTKLLRLASSNWELYSRGDNDGHVVGVHRLWKNIEPKLREDFKALSSHFLPMPEKKCQDLNSVWMINGNGAQGPKNFDDIPKYSKFILIAAYLATENPPLSDKRFFVKGATKKTGRKTKAYLTKDEDTSERTQALRSFDLNRLKSIFAFIVSYCSGGTEMYEPNVDLLVQISTLCQSRFIQNLGEDTSGNFKYRCLADYDFVMDLARSVDFELDKYLYRLL